MFHPSARHLSCRAVARQDILIAIAVEISATLLRNPTGSEITASWCLIFTCSQGALRVEIHVYESGGLGNRVGLRE
jgi:hypothetical protein